MVIEARKYGVRFVWAYILVGMYIDISVAFPLFLIARELRMGTSQTPYVRGDVPMSDGPMSEIWDEPDPPPYFQPVCAPFVPQVNCRPQNG